MDTLIWACRALHLFAAVVWCGGLMYQGAVLLPVARVEGGEDSSLVMHQLRRFVPFVWMSASTMLVTGVALMLFSPRFIAFVYTDAWSVLLGLKQMAFLLLVFGAFAQTRMLALCDPASPRGAADSAERTLARLRMVQFHQMSVALAIAALLLAASLSTAS